MTYPKLKDITKNSSLGISAYYRQIFNEYTMPYHSHNYYEIMFVDSGKAEIEVFNRFQKYEKFYLKKNDFVFIDTNVSHKLHIEVDNPCKIYNIEFSLSQVDRETLSFHGILDKCDTIFFASN